MQESHLTQQLAQTAARLIVDEGHDWRTARRKAAEALGVATARRRPQISDAELEAEVRAHIALFHAGTQPAELRALRRLALVWMQRLAEFAPHLRGAVWRGTATRLTPVVIDLYSDDSKAPEIALLNAGVAFEPGGGPHELPVLSLLAPCPELGERVALHLVVNPALAERDALKADAQGQRWRGSLAHLQHLVDAESEQ